MIDKRESLRFPFILFSDAKGECPMYAKKQNWKKWIWIAVLAVSVLLIAVSIGVMAWVYTDHGVNLDKFRKEPTEVVNNQTVQTTPQTPNENVSDPNAPSESAQPLLVENPIDFAALREVNSDAYAWIYVPNTDIDLPIFQADATKDDNFYMHHDIEGNYDFKGSIYSQRANKKDFSDPVTLLYGHRMLDKSMFTNLHNFRDDTFFEQNRYFYIYTPGHILTYEIVSAHQYDERHILNSFNFSKPEIFQEYIDYILAPKSMIANVREGVEVTTQDRIVTLSTCMEGGSARYLVQGVLIHDERTTE